MYDERRSGRTIAFIVLVVFGALAILFQIAALQGIMTLYYWKTPFGRTVTMTFDIIRFGSLFAVAFAICYLHVTKRPR